MNTNNLRVVPKQVRGIERVEAIVSAAKTHYAEAGRDAFHIDTVASLAGCSVPTIYRYFEDRISLLDTVAPDRDAAERSLKNALLFLDTSGHLSDADRLEGMRRLLSDAA